LTLIVVDLDDALIKLIRPHYGVSRMLKHGFALDIPCHPDTLAHAQA